MVATKMFLIRRYSSSTHLKVDLLILDIYFCVFYKGFSDLEEFWDYLPVSRLKYNALDDFQEVFQTTSISVVWTSWMSFGLPGSLLTKFLFHNRSERFDDFHEVQMTSMKSRRLRRSLRDNFEEVFQTTSRKSSGLPGSLLTKSPFHNRSERFGF
ncbi:hypothetical protein F2Q70_00040224 [Brassica cretica]|uniref:Uncharacterized protein n=1 Tax=Brassica cretica TaxID=69181 RepID=A0A8S9K8M8_BRACR|nr:hypothetical protein F2Q70_00040224 [Brassica cretica]